jgi:hypothetical protein
VSHCTSPRQGLFAGRQRLLAEVTRGVGSGGRREVAGEVTGSRSSLTRASGRLRALRLAKREGSALTSGAEEAGGLPLAGVGDDVGCPGVGGLVGRASLQRATGVGLCGFGPIAGGFGGVQGG